MPKFFQTIETDLAALLSPVETAVFGYFKSVMADVAAHGAEELMSVVTAAVATAEFAGGSGVEKFDAASAYILNELETKGIPFIENVVNGLIEAAVAALPAALAAV